jgi:hypothetical protein
VFINVWGALLGDTSLKDIVWRNDWLIKADPDAVIFPARLRLHLKPHTPGAFYMLNCNYNGQNLIFGAIEAFSIEAARRYAKSWGQVCINMPWHGWGEDSYMQRCMDALGVQGIPDFGLVGDARCGYAPCSDLVRAAFHPFKDVSGWLNCWNQAEGLVGGR